MPRNALILIDIQNDYFAAGKWPVDGIDTAAANAALLLEAARRERTLVIHVRHEIPAPGAPFFAPGTTGAEIHASVAPQDTEAVILKHFPNAFRETDLAQVLSRNKIAALTICGAMTQMCIDASARAAADLGYGVTVIHDACAAKSQRFAGREVSAGDVHAAFMAALEGTYCTLRSTGDALAANTA